MSDSALSKRYPVLIAGAGPVGLALAIELAWRGIHCLVVEQSDGAVDFPTTNLANTRTCEHLRRWGIADRMRFESGYPTDRANEQPSKFEVGKDSLSLRHGRVLASSGWPPSCAWTDISRAALEGSSRHFRDDAVHQLSQVRDRRWGSQVPGVPYRDR